MSTATRSVCLVLSAALLAACGGDGSVLDAGGVLDAPSTDLGADLGATDAATADVADAADATDATDAADATDASDAALCTDGGVVTDGGTCLHCTTGQRICGEACAAADDPAFGCGAASCAPCAIPNAGAVCTAGACAQGRCNDGFADCDLNAATGCEVVTSTDRDNCGACGHHCALPNAMAGCAGGQCTVGTCAAGFGDCDGMAANGCEADVAGSLLNCGMCGSRCAPVNATGRCTAGSCAVASCTTGFGDCDGMALNGCETDLQSSLASCGACGARCNPTNGAGACMAGTCTVVGCNANFDDCDNNPANGCEADLTSNITHCGTCTTRCEYPNATAVCRAGACAFGACLPGFADCDGDHGNGCEVQIATSVDNCGGCGRVCTRTNATQACVGGVCRIDHCDAGSADCNGVDADGCEMNVYTSLANCGACGHACSLAHATPVCDLGTCDVATCLPNYRNCNGSAVDGCESASLTDVLNCGDCGNVVTFAHATPACVGGAPAIASCNASYGDCDGDINSGCEAHLTNDPVNCGACGHRCSDVCSASACTTCTTGTAGNLCSNGTVCRCVGAACACQ